MSMQLNKLFEVQSGKHKTLMHESNLFCSVIPNCDRKAPDFRVQLVDGETLFHMLFSSQRCINVYAYV